MLYVEPPAKSFGPVKMETPADKPPQ